VENFDLCGCHNLCGLWQSEQSQQSEYDPTGPVNPTATGNWQISLTAYSGGEIFPTLSGYIKDDEDDTGSPSPFTTAEMTSYGSSGCFIGRNSIYLYGNVDGAQLPIYSDTVNGQVLALAATLDSTSSTMTGTYVVNGGCASGASGSISGFRVSTVSGTFTGGTVGTSTIDTVQLVAQQNPNGNGNGYFELAGSVLLSGISCFGTGTLIPSSSLITGTAIQLTASTSDPSGAQLVIQGSVDAAADTITVSSIQVTSGACAGSYGTAALNLQN
jgi:hypothetical protein